MVFFVSITTGRQKKKAMSQLNSDVLGLLPDCVQI